MLTASGMTWLPVSIMPPMGGVTSIAVSGTPPAGVVAMLAIIITPLGVIMMIFVVIITLLAVSVTLTTGKTAVFSVKTLKIAGFAIFPAGVGQNETGSSNPVSVTVPA
jgi:uncharacterized membrane protein